MSDARPNAPTLSRGIALRGVEAAEWLATRGTRVADPRELRLVTDELASGEFRLARLWHTAVTAELSVAEGFVLVVVPVEGSMSVAFPGRGRSELRPPGALVLADRSVATTVAETSMARFEITVEASMLPGALREALGEHVVLPDIATSFRAALISAANAVLNTELDVRSQGVPALRLAFSQLAVAIVSAGVEGDARASFSFRERTLYQRATDVIAERARDPAFTIDALARELRISERYLYRIFSSADASPAAAIRAARAAVARSYADGAAGRSLTAAERARLAGFRNATAMRRALQRGG
ncbi:hypothetical protein [Rathayibacter sp. Leaf296]|uniref:hypothetical protein n=1 Tax=Rathayibacter sp. Leaf296 TaxID=1736327 RepID=UPI0007023E67|nr:hypothetical protein [Rathayibacter sp. Leaf296]KQQ10149.1 hypothetical protein ASF46_03395 [Rathayibacter sp. Leaf296]